ncbi:hypothetical protein CTI12_AA597140 [Artemisia annua]|uniref:Uncharacterized protein n=1 Tax=Artemisia annua TaxID=35608 RepID=A0A2U1KJ15_ARTAN|nr:hypothetical protein CTI12_AA597140 [Artemisia annua]
MATCLAADGIVINMVVGGEVVTLKSIEESSSLVIAEMPINHNCVGVESATPPPIFVGFCQYDTWGMVRGKDEVMSPSWHNCVGAESATPPPVLVGFCQYDAFLRTINMA